MEKEEKLGQEPAFPIEELQKNINDDGISELKPHLGMSKRFYAACAVMRGISADTNVRLDEEGIKRCVALSYKIADELLKQENL